MSEYPKSTLFGLLGVVLQYAIILYIIAYYHIESQSFLRLCILLFPLWIIHHLLADEYRLPFFTFSSILAIFVVLGITVGLWILIFSLLLIFISGRPWRLSLKLVVLVVVVGILASLRINLIPNHINTAVWPILGSMFMFRLILFLYEQHHSARKISFWHAASYFFMAPNVCFPLFPVFDFRTFHRVRFKGAACEIYQRGFRLIVRGLVQLIIYRFVYGYLVIAPGDIENAGHLVRSLFATIFLYIKISGEFHIIAGLLHYFGFNLPMTNNYYFLSSSFTDFWRRANIYWKDFMVKVFYYPVFLKIKRMAGNNSAIVLATLSVFVATTLLHTYQWFWLAGKTPLTLQDILFWSFFGLLVLINSFRENLTKNVGRRISSPKHQIAKYLSLTVKRFTTFLVIVLLWSMWSSPELNQWWRNFTAITHWEFDWQSKVIIAWIGALFLLGAVVVPLRGTQRHFSQQLWHRNGVAIAGVLLLTGFSVPTINQQFDHTVVERVRTPPGYRLTKRDRSKLIKGYYEDITRVSMTGELWRLYAAIPERLEHIQETDIARETNDSLEYELLPNKKITFRGAALQTNEHAMVDHSYPKVKAPDHFRIALLGGSITMGWGVQLDQSFQAITEKKLNESKPFLPYRAVEILNFARGKYCPGHSLELLRRKVMPFTPDAIMLAGHSADGEKLASYVITMVQKKLEFPYIAPGRILSRAGVDSHTSFHTAQKLMKPHRDTLLRWCYQAIVLKAQQYNAVPLYVYVPLVFDDVYGHHHERYLSIAGKAGFITMDIAEAFRNRDRTALILAPWDDHPNAKGHALLADALTKELTRMAPEIIEAKEKMRAQFSQ